MRSGQNVFRRLSSHAMVYTRQSKQVRSRSWTYLQDGRSRTLSSDGPVGQELIWRTFQFNIWVAYNTRSDAVWLDVRLSSRMTLEFIVVVCIWRILLFLDPQNGCGCLHNVACSLYTSRLIVFTKPRTAARSIRRTDTRKILASAIQYIGRHASSPDVIGVLISP